MKRKAWILTLLMAFIFLAQPTARALAAQRIQIEELGVGLEAPEDLWVLKRDTPEDDPVWARLGRTPEEIRDYMDSQDLYLLLFPEGMSYQIFLNAFSDERSAELADLSRYDDEFIADYFTGFQDGQSPARQDIRILHGGGAKFARYALTEGEGIYTEYLTTVYNGKAYILSSGCEDPVLAEAVSLILAGMVQSISLPEREAAEPEAETPAPEQRQSPLQAAFDPKAILADLIVGAVAGGCGWLLYRVLVHRGDKKEL